MIETGLVLTRLLRQKSRSLEVTIPKLGMNDQNFVIPIRLLTKQPLLYFRTQIPSQECRHQSVKIRALIYRFQ